MYVKGGRRKVLLFWVLNNIFSLFDVLMQAMGSYNQLNKAYLNLKITWAHIHAYTHPHSREPSLESFGFVLVLFQFLLEEVDSHCLQAESSPLKEAD